MPKKFISNNAILNICFKTVLFSVILVFILNKLLNCTNNITICFIYLILLILIFAAAITTILIVISMIIGKKKFAAECVINLFNKNIIEFHVGNICEGNSGKLIGYFFKIINIALEQNKSIIFFTNHIKESNLRKIFRQALTVEKAKGLEKKANLRASKKAISKYNKKHKYNQICFDDTNYLMCYIRPELLTKKELKYIKKIGKRFLK